MSNGIMKLAIVALLLALSCVLGCSSQTQAGIAQQDAIDAFDVDDDIVLQPAEAGSGEDAEEEASYSMEEVSFDRDGLNIYGHLYLPAGEGPFPLVIIGHGFGGSLMGVEEYAMAFAENGIAACAFDFVGGGFDIRSDGDLTEMSVLTEAADMNVVMDSLSARSDIDADNVFLMGHSQGGFVATYVAGTRPESVRGLVCFYPAYVLQDAVRLQFADGEAIPDRVDILGITVGSIYCEDILSFSIYDVMANYPGPVLIVHGDVDSIAPISYSRSAVDVMPNAELVEIPGAGHGFFGPENEDATALALQFVEENVHSTNT